jgi:uncharacterized membrane protein
MKTSTLFALTLGAIALSPAAQADAPAYTIVDLGVVGTDAASQAFGISGNGSFVVGRSLGTEYSAFSWTSGGGMTALPNLAGRNYAVANGVNDAGVVVGTSSTTGFGSSPVPVMWTGGVVSTLPLPVGYTFGQAYAVNAAGVVAGAAGSGSGQRAALFTSGGSSLITATTANGSYMTAAFGINDAGLVVGSGVDPTNAAVNVGLVYDSATGVMSSVGALAGGNGALNFGVSNSGYVVGASMLNQGSGSSFIWSSTGGMQPIALPPNTSQGSARAVNDDGWVVGIASGAFAVPYLHADGTTYSLQDLLPADSGWNLDGNTSSSARGIADDGTIVGTGVFNGLTHAYQMTLVSSVPEPGTWALMLAGLVCSLGVARRRRHDAR